MKFQPRGEKKKHHSVAPDEFNQIAADKNGRKSMINDTPYQLH
jgi:hypothetical protein